jgi:agmatinase
MVEQVQKQVTRALRHGKTPCVVGGNHTVSLGAAKAVIGEYPDISILHIDAHTAYRDEYQDSKFSHACVMKRIQEQCDNIVSVGIRSTSEEEQSFLNHAKVFYAADLMKNHEDQDEWIEEIMMQLDPDVYISIDLDAFDPSEIPAVSTPEPGGLSWAFITNLLKAVAKHHNIVGFDVVELCPNRYLSASDFAAAKLIYNTFAYIHKYRKE